MVNETPPGRRRDNPLKESTRKDRSSILRQAITTCKSLDIDRLCVETPRVDYHVDSAGCTSPHTDDMSGADIGLLQSDQVAS
jgi:hypothetical protein